MGYILIGVFVLILIVAAVIATIVIKKMKVSDAEKREREEEKLKAQEEVKIRATQDQLPFEYIRKGIVKLKNDTFLKVLEVSSVNTQLMEAEEKEMVRETYAAVLNSLNFKIQFYKQSRLVDINEYLTMLEEISRTETNPAKKEGLEEYDYFIRELVRENSVQTKKDYIIISFKDEVRKKAKEDPDSLSKYRKHNEDTMLGEDDELYQKEKMFDKASKILGQREKVLEKQVRRLMVYSHTLNDKELFELFYTTYNRDRSVYQSMKERSPKDFASLYVKREGGK